MWQEEEVQVHAVLPIPLSTVQYCLYPSPRYSTTSTPLHGTVLPLPLSTVQYCLYPSPQYSIASTPLHGTVLPNAY